MSEGSVTSRVKSINCTLHLRDSLSCCEGSADRSVDQPIRDRLTW